MRIKSFLFVSVLVVNFICLYQYAMAAPLAYITGDSSSVSVIDTANDTVTENLNIGRSSYGVAVNPSGSRIFVTNNLASTLSIIDTSTNLVSSVPVGAAPLGVAVNADGTRVYVANSGDNSISVLDVSTDTPSLITTILNASLLVPWGICVASGKVYVTNSGTNTVSVIDTTNNTVTGEAITVGINPVGIAANSSGTKVYVANSGSGTVSVIDTSNNTVTGDAVTVGINPTGIAIDPLGEKVYVANSGSNTVSIINTSNNTVGGEAITVGLNPVGIAVNSSGTKVYVANRGANTVSVIETASPTSLTVTSITVETGPVAFGNFFVNNTIPPTVTSTSPASNASRVVVNISIKAVFSEAMDSSTINTTNITVKDSAGTAVTGVVALSGTTATFTPSADLQINTTYTVIITTGVKDLAGNALASQYTWSFTTGTEKSTEGGIKVKCFIATAAYGSYLDPHVKVLRDFRDKYLLSNRPGIMFVNFYYDNSPPVADFIARHESLRLMTRWILTPVVYVIEYPLGSIAFLFGIVLMIRKRKRGSDHV